MQRELSYRLPFARLTKLSRTASRKGYPIVWWLTWVWIGIFLAVTIGFAVFPMTLGTRSKPLTWEISDRSYCLRLFWPEGTR
jgi:hypothetical protein